MPLICVASPKGGVGKTSLVAGLADAFRREGRAVVAIDCDPQNALRLHLGLPLSDGAGYLARLPERPDWRACLRTTPAGVDLLPYGETDLRGAMASAAQLEREPEWLITPVRALLADPATIVLADTPPGASVSLALLRGHATLVLAVLLADAGSTALLPDIESHRFIGQGTLDTLNRPRLLVALNQVDHGSPLSVAAAEGVAAQLGSRLAGAVCRDDAMAYALATQRPVGAHAPSSRAARDVAALAAALMRQLPPPAPPAAPAPAAALPVLPWLKP